MCRTFYNTTSTCIIERTGSCDCTESSADERFQRDMPAPAIEIAEGIIERNPNITASEIQQGILLESMGSEHCTLDEAVSWQKCCKKKHRKQSLKTRLVEFRLRLGIMLLQAPVKSIT